MSEQPNPYPMWRSKKGDRAEDAAYTFGYHLMQHCRAEAMKVLDEAESSDVQSTRAHAEMAVDTALHNLMDLLEGFWLLKSGEHHFVTYTLTVNVLSSNDEIVERVDISPCMLDLPIGYWKWKDGEFQ